MPFVRDPRKLTDIKEIQTRPGWRETKELTEREDIDSLDYIITKSFLGTCSIAGILVPEYRRQTGEVY